MDRTPSLEQYNQLLAPARERFEGSPALNAIQSNSNPRLLESFLLYFCAIGAQMTEPVEGWIRRAASRCAALGHSELAEALTRHAQAESGHHLMMIADLRSLASHWNARRTPTVDAEALLGHSYSPGARCYCEIHERNIEGDTPYAQIAIEYEIEQLPLRYGGIFIARCLEIFGPAILPSLSFVTAHIDLDVGHTKFNERELSKLVTSFPESLRALTAAGGAALDAYGQFLSDCWELAQQHCSDVEDSQITPSRFLSWQLHSPPGDSILSEQEPAPKWLRDVRHLRGSVLFDSGRRPQFETSDNEFDDPDPIDLYAWHVLAYSGAALAGCVRVYPLAGSPLPCLTETLLDRGPFEEALAKLGKGRHHAFEIGRWVADPVFRTRHSLAPGIGLELAAGAGALALALAGQAEPPDGIAIFAAGSRDRQYLALSRLGLKPVPGIDPLKSSYYDDVIRVMYCASIQTVQPRFQRMMDAMAKVIKLDKVIAVSTPASK